jgi:hypothetical protein
MSVDSESSSVPSLGTPSSMRALAAAGADSMRFRIDAVVTGLRSALDDLTSLPGADGDALDEKLSLALDAAEEVRDGLGKLTFLSRGESEPAKELDIHEAIELALRMTRSIVGTRARVVRRYDRVSAVRADRSALTRVFAQLLQNAADAIPPYMPLANTISVRTYDDGEGSVVVEVSDTGIGMSMENLAHAFDPFFTTKSGAADGLGLTIVRGEVLAAGGSITAESVEGRGSRFVVRLRAVAGATGNVDRVFTSELPHRRVLVVSDEEAMGKRLRALLDDDRTVVAIARVEDAIERLAMGEACDLVGIEANEAARVQWRERLTDVAPDALMRTFELRLPRSPLANEDESSGMWSVGTR